MFYYFQIWAEVFYFYVFCNNKNVTVIQFQTLKTSNPDLKINSSSNFEASAHFNSSRKISTEREEVLQYGKQVF